MSNEALAIASVQIEADLSRLTAGLDAAKRDTERAASDMERGLKKIGSGATEAAGGVSRLEAETRKATAGARAVADEVGGRFAAMGDNAGLLGVGLKAMGPAGVAAAAGIGAIGVGLAAASQQARDAVASFAEIGGVAEKIGITTDYLQEMRAAATALAHIDPSALDDALQELALKMAEAASEGGDLKDRFDALGVKLTDSTGALRPMPEVMNDVARGMQGLASDADRLRAAEELFGDEGKAMVNVLKDGGRAMEEARAKARELGLVIDQDMIRRSQEMEAQFTTASQVVGTNLKKAFIDLAPAILAVVQVIADGTRALADFIDSWRSLENRTTRGLEGEKARLADEVGQLNAQLQEAASAGPSPADEIAGGGQSVYQIMHELEDRQKRLAEVDRLLAERQKAAAETPVNHPVKIKPKADSSGGKTPADAIKEAQEALASLKREYGELRTVSDAAYKATDDLAGKTVEELQRRLKDVEALMFSKESAIRIAQAAESASIPKGATQEQEKTLRALAADAEREKIRNEGLKKFVGDSTSDIEKALRARQDADKKADEARLEGLRKAQEAADALSEIEREARQSLEEAAPALQGQQAAVLATTLDELARVRADVERASAELAIKEAGRAKAASLPKEATEDQRAAARSAGEQAERARIDSQRATEAIRARETALKDAARAATEAAKEEQKAREAVWKAVQEEAEKARRAAEEAAKAEEERAQKVKDALEDLKEASADARAEADMIGMSPEAVRRLKAQREAADKMRAVGAPEDRRGYFEAAAYDRLSEDARGDSRRSALELLEKQATLEEKAAEAAQKLKDLQPALAALIRERALAQGDAAGAALAEAEAQRIVSAELEKMDALRQTMDEIGKRFGEGIAQSLEDVVFGAKSATEAIRGLALEIAKMAFQKLVTQPLGSFLGKLGGGLFGGLLANADGNAFDSGGVVHAFAAGGVVDRPMLFGFGGGRKGLMGEAGPEAILPLRRGPDGRLGVASGGGVPNVTINIATPDVEGFRRSEGQLSAALARVVGRGRRQA